MGRSITTRANSARRRAAAKKDYDRGYPKEIPLRKHTQKQSTKDTGKRRKSYYDTILHLFLARYLPTPPSKSHTDT